jgi:peptidyl-prolyl cis-trans isomerase SurA
MFSIYLVSASEAKVVEKILVIVNDDIITQTELNEQLAKSKEMLRQMYQYDEAQLSAEIEKAKPEILESMIDERLFTQEAVNLGIQVKDSEIQQYISNLRDQFGSAEALQEALEAEGYTMDSFRRERRRELLRQELVKQKFGSEIRVTDNEVKKFYNENKDQFPDRSDTVKLKHIFIKFDITEADKEKARHRAENILSKVKTGSDFGQMASDLSDHEPTKMVGGDMGYFIPGMGKYDSKIEEAASKLAVGEISDLIESPGGYDIIKVTEIKPPQIRAQRIYIAAWPDPSAEKAAEAEADSILDKLKKGANFVEMVKKYSDDPLALENDGDWKDMPIDAMAPGLKKAFDSFNEGEISRKVRTPFGFHIFKIIKRQNLTEDEMEQLRELLRQKKLQEKISEYSKKLREKAYILRLAED